VSAAERLLAHPGLADVTPDFYYGLLAGSATLLLDLADTYGRLDDRTVAVSRLRHVLAHAPADWDARPGTILMLSRALYDRFFVSRVRADLDEAIECGRAAVQATEEGDDRRSAAASLLNAFHGLFPAMLDEPSSTRDALLEEGAGLAAQVRASPAADPAEQASRLTSTGLFSFGQFAIASDDRRPLDAAIEDLRAAVALAPERTADRAHYNRNLGVALAQRHDLFHERQDLDDGLAALRCAIDDGLRLAPEQALDAGRQLGCWAVRRGAWDEAADAWIAALSGRELLHRAQVRSVDQETWLQDSVGLPSLTAYGVTRAGRPLDAVIALEVGLAMLHSERLGEARRYDTPSPEHLVSLAAAAPLVYLVCTDLGGAALIVGSGREPVVVRMLDGLTTAALKEQLGRYSPGISSVGAEWRRNLDEVLVWLWRTVMEGVLDALGDAPAAVLITDGALGLLPLHAARPGPRLPCALDLCALRYAPVARAVGVTAGEAPSVAAVGEPARTDQQRLIYATSEAEGIAASFHTTNANVLSGRAATRDAVAGELRRASVVHFACHARANMAAPRESTLMLAGKDRLTLDDLLALPTGGFRLAVLSACESGVQGEVLPEEKFSLAIGMLQAGAAGVIASLWSVDDRSTMILMLRFYELWRLGGERCDEALRQAQLWVRDSTNAEKLAFARVVANRMAERDGTCGSVAARVASAYEGEEGAARSAAEPYHWAGFGYVGV
jgi:tetratricopeptide (TPR) repeat protein